ncbi:MAG: hypothetical protein D6731_05255 [Planctomycetota bacterium]|nr:MAG: hypothetical protein D6731_05255 [Planctomycetota bacterium]
MKALVREADDSDDAALCELFARVAMEGDLSLAVEREPSFFALYELQRLIARRVFVAEVEGKIEGVAAYLARRGHLGGRVVPVGYLGDLRLGPRLRGGFFFGRRFGPRFRACLADSNAEVALTAVLATNRAALRFLTRRSRRFPDKPVYRPWRAFSILNVHFTRRRRPRPTRLEVRRATSADLPEVAALLARDHARRPFGYVFDEELLRERLARWPGLRLEDFYLAFRGGELVGATALWDAHAVKRFRVLAYRGSMRWLRLGFNLGAPFLGCAPLPPAGGVLRYAYLTHTSIPSEDPDVLAALFDRLYADAHGRGYAFVSTYVEDGDPLGAAFARYRCTPLPARLFTVSPPGSPWNERDPGAGRPGFEMALV